MITVLLPLLAAVYFFFIKGKAIRMVALGASLVQFVITGYYISQFVPSGGIQFTESYTWSETLGISFSFGMDGISLLMLILTNFLVPLIIVASFEKEFINTQLFYGLVLLMQAALNGVFIAQDGLLFYFFWELALIPIWFICAIWGGEDRIRITLKFFIYTFSGSLLMLVAFIILYLQTPGTHSFSLEQLYSVKLSASQQCWVFWFFFIAFAIKIPIFPFHTWQPDTYTTSPTAGTMLLSGIMLKMGLYGIIRWMLPFVPDMLSDKNEIAIWLALAGVVYAGLIAIRINDMKRMIAYSSISHVGLIAAGIFAMNKQGIEGSMLQMFNHGINIVGLFFIVDIIERRMNTRNMQELGGIAGKAPAFAVMAMIIVLGAVAVPLTNGFAGELLLLKGIFSSGILKAAIGGLTVIFCAVYMLRMYQFSFFGEAKTDAAFVPLTKNEWVVLFTISVVVIITGFFPQPIIDLVAPSISEWVKHFPSTITGNF